MRKLREAKGLTLRQLAEIAELNYTAIGRLENDPDRSERRTIDRVAKALGTTVAELLTVADPIFPTTEQRELLTLYEALDQKRQQNLLTFARRGHEALKRADHEHAEEAVQDPAKKATG